MSQNPTVLFNGSCPICSREIASYNAYCTRAGVPMVFTDLVGADLADWGVTTEDARRRLHVMHDGKVVAGLQAFIVLWGAMPRFRWLARVVSLPGIRQAATFGYDRVAAPALYALDRRRRR